MVKCITNGCEGDAITRGLCPNCYQAARNIVARGKSTWEKLEELGLSVKSKGSGRRSGIFTNVFNKALEAVANDTN